MSDEGPKLFTNKPKKSKLKASTPITMASSSSSNAAATPPSPPPPPPPPQKLSFFQRNRFLVPLLLAVNFTVGAYLFTRTSTKDKGKSEEEIPDHPTSSTSTSTATAPAAAAIIEKPVTPPIMEPIQRPPIPEDQQRELFKWMLEERRKMKPKDPEEKKRIDEEKAILKQFIRAKSVPTI